MHCCVSTSESQGERATLLRYMHIANLSLNGCS